MRYLLKIYYIEEHFDLTPLVHIVYLALYEIVTICLNIVLFLVQMFDFIFEFDSFIQNDLDKVYQLSIN
jgi:hypothetical protein